MDMTRKVVFLLVALASAGAGAMTPERAGELRHLLLHDCGSCHGMTLKGGIGPALEPNYLGGKPDAYLAATILDGRSGTPMPPWRGILTEDEVDWLVQTLRSGVNAK